MAVNCGDCLCNDVVIVELVDGICPRCGADYKPKPEICEICGALPDRCECANVGMNLRDAK